VKDHNIWKEDYIVPIKPSGSPLNLTEVQSEFGGAAPIAFSEYYGLVSGLPTSGQPFPMSSFYEKDFVEVEIITSDTTWNPKTNIASFIHIFVVGAGGSGAAVWPQRSFTDGSAAAGGGGAGGVSYSRIPGPQAGRSTITIGIGGSATNSPNERNYIAGSSGSRSTFTGSGLVMTANGGFGGNANGRVDGGRTTASVVAAVGGSATGGNIGNFTGGSGGAAFIRVSNVGKVASGGGAPSFQTSHETLKNGVDASGSVGSAGASVSTYGSYPDSLNSYLISRSATPVLSSSITTFDASSGRRDASSSAVTYGAGSGGIATESSTFSSGRGGNGVVIIVYEI
jgi:hypothetical protein